MHYLEEERETSLTFDPIKNEWRAWTTVPKHINKLQKCGWKMGKNTVSEGRIIDAWFTAPANAITFRDMKKALSPNRYKSPKGTVIKPQESSALTDENAKENQ